MVWKTLKRYVMRYVMRYVTCYVTESYSYSIYNVYINNILLFYFLLVTFLFSFFLTCSAKQIITIKMEQCNSYLLMFVRRYKSSIRYFVFSFCMWPPHTQGWFPLGNAFRVWPPPSQFKQGFKTHHPFLWKIPFIIPFFFWGVVTAICYTLHPKENLMFFIGKVITTVLLALSIILFISFMIWCRKDKDRVKVFVVFGLVVIGMIMSLCYMWCWIWLVQIYRNT